MTVQRKSVILIGGGPAGLAAAVSLCKQGITDILVIEREHELGGILRQCIHDGFGLTRFQESLSGPEYAARFIDEIKRLDIETVTDTTVITLTPDKTVVAMSASGQVVYEAKAVILTLGCRERTRGAIRIPGTRPAGIYTAGVAQAYMNLKNLMVGREIVILGSGDIGLIMARRMTLEGAHVQGVFEIQPYASGLPRNIEQCLHDYQIPLHLSHTVTNIRGRQRLEGVTVSQVDGQFTPIPGTERDYACDTLILSVGLIPENELSSMAGVVLDPRTHGPVVDEHYQTNVEGIFAAGNVLHVHDLVDFVSLEAEQLADAVAGYLAHGRTSGDLIPVQTDHNLGYTVPQHISGDADFTLSLRVKTPMRNCRIAVMQGDATLKTAKRIKAIPAEMIHIPVKRAQLVSREPIKVVVTHDE
ncbi:MAG TPA: FAD-dependent oxidoreductase [Clostridia bacterium]